MNSEKLLKYKGWRLNKLTMNTIEYEFEPYKLEICNIDEFNNEINNEVTLHKTIKCLVFRGVIIDLKLN